MASASSSSAFTNIKYEHAVAGISGGIASTLALHPLDLLKVRLAGLYLLYIFQLIIYCVFSLSQ